MEFGVGLALIFSVLAFFSILYKGNKEFFFYALIVLVVFQNPISLLLLQYLSRDILLIWSGLKEVILVIAFVLGLNFLTIKNPLDRFYLVLLLIFGLLILTSPNGVIGALKSSRSYLLPPILYFIGRNMRFNKVQIARANRFLIAVFFILVSAGIVEKVYGQEIWTMLNYQGYILSKYGLNIYDRIGFNNLGYLPLGFGIYIRPMSLFGESVGLGFFLASIAVVNYTISRKPWMSLLLLVGVAFIYIRGVLLAIAVGFLLNRLMFSKRLLGSFEKPLLWGSVLSILILATYIVIMDPNFLSSHLVSLVSGFKVFLSNPLGLGLGSANWIDSFSKNEMAISSIDSFFATTLVELGVFGLVFYVTNIYFLIIVAPRYRNEIGSNDALLPYIVTLFLVSVLSASVFSFHSIVIIYLFHGILTGHARQESGLLNHELPISTQYGTETNKSI